MSVSVFAVQNEIGPQCSQIIGLLTDSSPVDDMAGLPPIENAVLRGRKRRDNEQLYYFVSDDYNMVCFPFIAVNCKSATPVISQTPRLLLSIPFDSASKTKGENFVNVRKDDAYI